MKSFKLKRGQSPLTTLRAKKSSINYGTEESSNESFPHFLGSAGKGYFTIDQSYINKTDLKRLKRPYHDSSDRAFNSNPEPIIFNDENREILFREFFSNTDKSFPLRNRRINAEEPFRSNIRLLYLALDGYLESKNPVENFDTIINRVLKGPDGIVEMKRIKNLSYVNSAKLEYIEPPEWINDVPSYQIYDIGDIFNWQYMFNWKLPDEEDYLWGNEPLCINKEMIDQMKKSLRGRLPSRDSFEKVDPNEILLQQTSSSNLNPITFKNEKNWILRGSFSTFANNGLKGKRTIIQTAVGQSRDSILLPIDQLNTINLIDRQISNIIQSMWGNKMVKDYNTFQKKLNKDRRNFNHFICRDIKKEGITKPRELLKAILEVIDELYPDLNIRNYSGIYNSYTLVKEDGEELSMKRGHGLGMANSLTTLMQLAVFYLITDRLHEFRDIKKSDLTCGAFNDDFYVGTKEEDFLDFYWDEEEYVFDQLGLIREPRKSFRGKDFVLCETYNKELNYKESYSRREILNSLCAFNIVHAKSIISSLSRSFNEYFLEVYLDEIISYWGYEFHKDEIFMTSRLGGWINKTGRLVSFDLYEIGESKYYKSFFEAGKLNSVRKVFFKRPKQKVYTAPVTTLFRIDDFGNDTINTLFNIGDFNQIRNRFVRTSENGVQSMKAWADLLYRRKKTFGKHFEERITKGQLERDLISYYTNIDFVPFETARGFLPLEKTSIPLEDSMKGFRSSNPRMSYLKYTFPDKFPDHILPNPIPFLLGNRTINLSQTAAERKERDGEIGARSRIDFEPLNDKSFSVLGGIEDYFINPRMVLALCANRFYTKFPIPSFKGEKEDLINLAKSVFIRDEVLIISHSSSFERQKIISDAFPDDIEPYYGPITQILNEEYIEKTYVEPVEEEPGDSDDEEEPDLKRSQFSYFEFQEGFNSLTRDEQYSQVANNYDIQPFSFFWTRVRYIVEEKRLENIITNHNHVKRELSDIDEDIWKKLKEEGVNLSEFDGYQPMGAQEDDDEVNDPWGELGM
jgi:hypothetical protein